MSLIRIQVWEPYGLDSMQSVTAISNNDVKQGVVILKSEQPQMSKNWADVEDNEEDFGYLFDPPPVEASVSDESTKPATSAKQEALETIRSPLVFSFMKNR